MSTFKTILLPICLVLILAGCTSKDDNSSTANITLGYNKLRFDTDTITVKKGDTVQITFTGDNEHTLAIDEFDVETFIENSPTTVTFVADKVGTFTFYCGVGFHALLGMQGKLIVEE